MLDNLRIPSEMVAVIQHYIGKISEHSREYEMWKPLLDPDNVYKDLVKRKMSEILCHIESYQGALKGLAEEIQNKNKLPLYAQLEKEVLGAKKHRIADFRHFTKESA